MRLTHVYRNCEWTWMWLTDKVAAGLRHISGTVNDCIRRWVNGEIPDGPTQHQTPSLPLLPPTPDASALGPGVVIPEHIYFGPGTGGPSIADVGFVPNIPHIGERFTQSPIPPISGFIPPHTEAAISEPTTLLLFVCAVILLWAVYEIKERT